MVLLDGGRLRRGGANVSRGGGMTSDTGGAHGVDVEGFALGHPGVGHRVREEGGAEWVGWLGGGGAAISPRGGDRRRRRRAGTPLRNPLPLAWPLARNSRQLRLLTPLPSNPPPLLSPALPSPRPSMASLAKSAAKLADKRKRNALVAEQTELELASEVAGGPSSTEAGGGRRVKRRKDKVRSPSEGRRAGRDGKKGGEGRRRRGGGRAAVGVRLRAPPPPLPLEGSSQRPLRRARSLAVGIRRERESESDERPPGPPPSPRLSADPPSSSNPALACLRCSCSPPGASPSGTGI